VTAGTLDCGVAAGVANGVAEAKPAVVVKGEDPNPTGFQILAG
jgi:hypothetical protein